MALMVGLGVYSVTSIGARLDTIVHGHYRDTMNAVDIRETVNEVARAVYNLATTADMETRRRDVARLEGTHAIISKNLEALKTSLTDHEGAGALQKVLATHGRYDTAKRKVMALAEAFGHDRCLWGSDWPFVRLDMHVDYGPTRAVFDRWVPDAKVRQKILWDTPARLFGFK